MTEPTQLVIFEADSGQVQVRLEGDTIWLSQAQMAELFGTSSDNISLHLKNIFSDQELQEQATTEDFSVVLQEGQRQVKRRLKHYNLDAIISVGYRINSARATRFRQWATQILRVPDTERIVGAGFKPAPTNNHKLPDAQVHLKGRG